MRDMLKRSILAASLVLVLGCKEQLIAPVSSNNPPLKTDQKGASMTQEISIKIGEQGKDWLARYPHLVKTHRPIPIAEHYRINWDSQPHGRLKIDHGQYSFVIEDVLSVSTMQDVEPSPEGASSFHINAGMAEPSPGLIPHAQARDKIYALLKQIEARGWRVISSRGSPRLKGQARLNHVLSVTNTLGLDTEQMPTLAQWMDIPSHTNWRSA